MTTPNQPNGPNEATEPIEAAPTETLTPEPQTEQTAAPNAHAPTVVPVQRRWLVAGSAVGALAVVGLAFGAGFLVGDATGNSGHRGDGYRGHERLGGERLGGRHLFIVPGAPDSGQDGQAPTTQAPATTTPVPS
ncbi:hypothetical protein L5I01_07150 [Gordonia sp. HY442]|uniref:hypothetical protein n=1 Tax=Gordonia zhenghanii TaxID=2911516 RepID=UPI001F40BB66|nr:hypothetical protein [Gordonia zhenghanii]MCF8603139.1 hypothetical protein [Gordonia zhenghanii]